MERRTYTVMGQKASPEEIDRLIETGESETIFAKAILEQGRGQVNRTASIFARTELWACLLYLGRLCYFYCCKSSHRRHWRYLEHVFPAGVVTIE